MSWATSSRMLAQQVLETFAPPRCVSRPAWPASAAARLWRAAQRVHLFGGCAGQSARGLRRLPGLVADNGVSAQNSLASAVMSCIRSVLDANQVQAASGSRWSGSTAVAGFQNTGTISFTRRLLCRLSRKVPTRLRTMWCRNPSPRTVKISSSSVRIHSAEWMVRTFDGAPVVTLQRSSVPHPAFFWSRGGLAAAMRALRSGSEAANEVKSCVADDGFRGPHARLLRSWDRDRERHSAPRNGGQMSPRKMR